MDYILVNYIFVFTSAQRTHITHASFIYIIYFISDSEDPYYRTNSAERVQEYIFYNDGQKDAALAIWNQSWLY